MKDDGVEKKEMVGDQVMNEVLREGARMGCRSFRRGRKERPLPKL